MAKKKPTPPPLVVSALASRLIGQSEAVDAIAPYVQMYQAGLAPEGRPVGVFLLLGPTGTGKTRTVEALTEILHGSERNVLKIDCGEYQLDHEVAKLIGAPPGYLGHRETQPVLTQAKLNASASERTPLSLVLFDEIEKAAPALTRLLLGVLDKATLRLGDANVVNFEHSMIFLTSNIGARDIGKEFAGGMGLSRNVPADRARTLANLGKTTAAAVKRQFSPEFLNRVDRTISYAPLDAAALATILDQQLGDLQRHLDRRLGVRSFILIVPPDARAWLLLKGTNAEYGARELKRTIQRSLMQPIALLVGEGAIQPGAHITADVGDGRLTFRSGQKRLTA